MKFNPPNVWTFILKKIMLRIRQSEWMDLICSLVQIMVLLRLMKKVIIAYISQLRVKYLAIEILADGKNIKML